MGAAFTLTVAEMHSRSINSVANEFEEADVDNSKGVKPAVERIQAAISEPAVS